MLVMPDSVTAARSCVALFAPGINTHCNCLIPCSTDELLHYKLQQLLRSAEEAVGVQELVYVAFHSRISMVKKVRLNSQKKVKLKSIPSMNFPWSNIPIGKKLNQISPVTNLCKLK